MIHDVRKDHLDLDLSRYRLTFDDGLFSQYYYHRFFEPNRNEKIFFIISSFIKPGRVRSAFDGNYLKPVKSRDYMYAAFLKNRFEHFMSLQELRLLAGQPRVRIGCHSHFHDVVIVDTAPQKPLSRWKLARCAVDSDRLGPQGNIRSKLAFAGYEMRNGRLVPRSERQWLDYIKTDTECALRWFEKNLGFTPEAYCFPFNEHSRQLQDILEGYGFKEFYSKTAKNKKIHPRIDIDKLVS